MIQQWRWSIGLFYLGSSFKMVFMNKAIYIPTYHWITIFLFSIQAERHFESSK